MENLIWPKLKVHHYRNVEQYQEETASPLTRQTSCDQHTHTKMIFEVGLAQEATKLDAKQGQQISTSYSGLISEKNTQVDQLIGHLGRIEPITSNDTTIVVSEKRYRPKLARQESIDINS